MSKRRRIGLIFENETAYPRGVLRGIKQFAQTRPDWILVLLDPEALRGQELKTAHLEGFVANVIDQRVCNWLQAQQRPVINTSSVLPNLTFPTVMVDNREVGRMAGEHLMHCGLPCFGIIAHPRHLYSIEREAGFRESLAGTSSFCETFYERTNRSFRKRTCLLAIDPELQHWLKRLPKPVGIFACDDVWGLQVVEACRLAEMQVPQQVAVIGVDNDDLLCGLARPPLSSIIVPAERIGFESAKLLDRLIHRSKVRPGAMVVPPLGVVARQSSDFLPGDDAELRLVIRYIRDYAHLPLTVADVVKVVPVSRRVLEQRFQRMLKRGIGEEIRRVHLVRAKLLLANSMLSVADVAEQSGYGSTQYFSRVFRRETGQTPSQFRASSHVSAAGAIQQI